MYNSTTSISYEELDYMYNLINTMRNDILLQNEEAKKQFELEKQQDSVSFGYLTTYERQDGSTFCKRTKYRPKNSSTYEDLELGDFNSYGHKVICIVEDIQLNLGLDIDTNKKWYVD